MFPSNAPPTCPIVLTASSDSKAFTLVDEFLLACVLDLGLGRVSYCWLGGLGRTLAFVEEFPLLGGAGADRLGIRFDAVTMLSAVVTVSLVRGILGLGTGLVLPIAVSAVLSPTSAATSLLG